MRKRLILPLCIVLMICLLPICAHTETPWENPFSDVSEEMWFYEAVSALNKADIIEDAEEFLPETYETRAGVVNYLYMMYISQNGSYTPQKECPFADISSEDKHYNAICWAYENGIAAGIYPDLFGADKNITREQVATFIIRYAHKFDTGLKKVNEPDQFKDSLDINTYARSAVAVCKMADMINGYENGYFYPYRPIKRNEAASIVYKFKKAADSKKTDSAINTSPNAYDSLYDSYISYFVPRVAQSPAVDISYFDNCALVGDSVTLSLKNYCAATGALGNATFLCAGSMSARNALQPLNTTNAIHPSYKGVKMTVEDAVLASGVDKVYIMLGMNGISFGIEEEIGNIVTLANRILEKSPHVKIFMQSVTPIASSSNIKGSKLNNTKIAQYNARLEQVCKDNKWYFINVAEVVTGPDGYLIREYCSDFGGMGIHFTKTGDMVWIDYLRTHVPEELR